MTKKVTDNNNLLATGYDTFVGLFPHLMEADGEDIHLTLFFIFLTLIVDL